MADKWKDKFRGYNALITGASQGIGLSYAHNLANMGANVMIVSNDEVGLKNAAKGLKDKYSVEVRTFYCDLTGATAAEDVYDYCNSNNYKVDILINNAGIFNFREVLKTPMKRLDMYIMLHIHVVTHLCTLFAGDMVKRKRGYILNMSSMSCWMPNPGLAMYSATKSYIRVFSRSMYPELIENNVVMSVACPGAIDTDLYRLKKNLRRLGVKLGILTPPEVFTRRALIRMFKGKKQYINGWLNHVSIVFVSIIPMWVRLCLKHKLLDPDE